MPSYRTSYHNGGSFGRHLTTAVCRPKLIWVFLVGHMPCIFFVLKHNMSCGHRKPFYPFGDFLNYFGMEGHGFTPCCFSSKVPSSLILASRFQLWAFTLHYPQSLHPSFPFHSSFILSFSFIHHFFSFTTSFTESLWAS